MIYVIAANARIGAMVARGKGASSRDSRYIHDWSQLQGLRDVTVYVYWGGVDSALVRSRMTDNYETAKRRGLTLADVAESELRP